MIFQNRCPSTRVRIKSINIWVGMDHQQNPLTGQLGEIKKVSLARLICDNSDGTITQIQPRAFRLPSK